MELVNVVEKAVWQNIDAIMAEKPDMCKCPKCRADVAAVALNNIKPRYTVSEAGAVITRAEILDQSIMVNIMVAIAMAVEQVYQKPRHDGSC